VLADEALDLLLAQALDHLARMADHEAVVADHDGKADIGVLRDANRLDHVVEDLLGVLAEEVDPPRIASAHGVGMVAVDIDVAREGSVRHCHRDRTAEAGCYVEHLPHEAQALGGSGGHDSSARSGGANAG